LANPECYDDDTAELLEWFDGEIARRGTVLSPDPYDEDEPEGVVPA
jgi:hypothetical protein